MEKLVKVLAPINKEFLVAGNTMKEVLKNLYVLYQEVFRLYGPYGELRKSVSLYLNGELVFLDDNDINLNEEDIVLIVPSIAGG